MHARGRARRGQRAARGRDRAGARARSRAASRRACADRCARRSRRCRATSASWSRSRRSPARPLRSARARPAGARTRGRRRGAADRPAARPPTVGSDSATRCCATPSTRRSPSRAGAACTSAGRRRCWPASRRARSRARPRSRATCGSPAPTGPPSRSSSAPPPTRARWPRSSRRSPISRRRSRSRPNAPICGSSSASSRRGGGAASRPKRRSTRALALLSESRAARHARARGCGARAPTTDRSASRARCSTARRNALELLERAERPRREERSEALAAWAWAEAVAGSVEEAERLLAELSADARGSDDLRTYDVGHARALALMRRGRFAESYGPSIAAGEAIEPRRPARPRVRLLGRRRQRRDRRRRARARARVPRSRHGGDRRSGTPEPRDPPAGGAIVRAPGLGRLEEARAAAESEQALAEQLAQPELLAMASHDRGLVALEAGEHELAASCSRTRSSKGRRSAGR